MVNAKNNGKKSNPRRQRDAVKKHGKSADTADTAELRVQLDTLGLKIVEVTSDGNCFFRALADQLVGNQEEHGKYRDMVVKYILSHREDFEPFIEDDIPFDEYCKSMEKDGAWAGHMELQAASLVTKRNICIHRLRSPRWYITNFSGHQSHMIHLCYHDGEHYNSVRIKEDSCEGPVKPISIKVDANISASDGNKKVTANNLSKQSSQRYTYNVGLVKLVMAGTGCENFDKVEQVLQEVNGDVDAAIEFLIAEEESNEHVNSNIDLSCLQGLSTGEDQTQDYRSISSQSRDMKLEQDKGGNKIQSVQLDETFTHDKKIPINKECSCGSKKKHKRCCGSDVGKSTSPAINGKHAPSKGKKNIKTKKQATRGVSQSGPASPELLPDLGALCI